MCHLFKSKAVSNFRDIPIGLFKQNFGFLNNPATNDVGGSFSGILFQYFIQMVDVHSKTVGIIFCRAQAQPLIRRFDRELAFK